MSNRARGADGPVPSRLSVNMAAGEAEDLAAAARRAGLSLGRYLVESGRRCVGGLTVDPSAFGVVGPRLAPAAGRARRGNPAVEALLLFRARPCEPGALTGRALPSPPNRLFRPGEPWAHDALVGDVVVEACRSGECRVSVVEPRTLRAVAWKWGADVPEVVDRVLAEHGR